MPDKASGLVKNLARGLDGADAGAGGAGSAIGRVVAGLRGGTRGSGGLIDLMQTQEQRAILDAYAGIDKRFLE